ncbi:MAG: hypothetical protein DMF90_01625 [Acidobacteria bacterium]|nr:MAG: hypothetical protein DMF90_01625 [Acidobacteriota bacterium]
MVRRALVASGVLTWLELSAVACQRPPAAPAFTPGLGEIMTLTQMRHSKLWFAGQAGNWPLASYELDELNEGMEDAAKFHPTHKDASLPIPALIEKIMKEPIEGVEKAVAARDQAGFSEAFDKLTEGCNACHRATNFGFNTVTRPAANPYSNQAFEPAR